MSGAITFRKGTFNIALTPETGNTVIPFPVDGYVSSDGAWGIHKDLCGWRITHLASGLRAGPTFSRLCNAKRYAKVMASRPDLWVFPEEFGKHPEALKWGPTDEQTKVIQAARAAGGIK